MDNFLEFYFRDDAAMALFVSTEVASALGMRYVHEISLFSALAITENSFFNSYLLRRGLTEEKMLEGISQLTEKYAQDAVKDPPKCQKVSMAFIIEGGKTVSANVLISYDYWDCLTTMCRKKAKKVVLGIEAIEITTQDMLKTFIEKFSYIYEEYMDLCFPSMTTLDKVISTITIPKDLQSFLTIMNDKYSPDETRCPILKRDKETKMLINILSKAKKRNAILVGDPGVGKTAIAEKLAWSIATGNCHEKFNNFSVVSLDVTSIIADTKYRGEAEARFKKLIEFLKDNENCILFIDEIHTVLGAGACVEGELDLGNSLKPILARGETRVIGGTTQEEYEKYFSKDKALKRRFEKIYVREPYSHEVYPMIKNQIAILQEFHGVTISRKMVDVAILNAACFNYQTKNPDRTLDVIDRAMATAALNNHSRVVKSDVLENFDIYQKQYEKTSDFEKIRIAYHEIGHFILKEYSSLLKNMKTLAISIMPAEGYLGVNVIETDTDVLVSDNYEYFIHRIAALLGGRVAEKMYISELSAGARSDLKEANELAEKMVISFGFAKDGFKERVYSSDKNIFITNKSKGELDRQVRKILKEAKKYAVKVLEAHQDEMRVLVDALMEHGIINQREIEELLKNYPKEAK